MAWFPASHSVWGEIETKQLEMMFSCDRYSMELLTYQRVRCYRTVSDEKINGASLKPDTHLFPSCNRTPQISFFACHLQWISKLLFQHCHTLDGMWFSHFFKAWHVTPFPQKTSLLLRFSLTLRSLFFFLVLFTLCHFTLRVKCTLMVTHFLEKYTKVFLLNRKGFCFV